MGLFDTATNFLNPTKPGNIWNTPVLRNIQQPLVDTTNFVRTLPQNIASGLYNPIANVLNKGVSTLRTPNPQAKGNLFKAIQQGAINTKNVATSPEAAAAAAEAASFAIPFGKGANFLTQSVVPGAVAGGVYEAGQPNATPAAVGESALFGGATAGAIHGGSALLQAAAPHLKSDAARAAYAMAVGADKIAATPAVKFLASPEAQRGAIDFSAPIGGAPPPTAQPLIDKLMQQGTLAPQESQQLFADPALQQAKTAFYAKNPKAQALTEQAINTGDARGVLTMLSQYMHPETRAMIGDINRADAHAAGQVYQPPAPPPQIESGIHELTAADIAKAKTNIANAQNQPVRFLKTPKAEPNLPGTLENPAAEAQPTPSSFLAQRMEAVNKSTTNPLTDFESSIKDQPTESIAYFNNKGDKVYQSSSKNKYSAKAKIEDLKKLNGVAVVSSHNHHLADPANPNSKLNDIALAPDKDDLSMALARGVKEVRTVSPRGVISNKFPENLDKQTVGDAFHQASINGELAYKESLARGEKPYFANVLRVKAENDTLVKNLNITVTKTPATNFLKSSVFTDTTGDKAIDSKAKIVQMSPDEYLKKAFENTDGKLGGSYESWLSSNQNDASVVQTYAQHMKNGDKFPVPYLDEARGSQDGRTRALAAKLLGEKTIPVAVVPKMTPQQEISFLQGELNKNPTPYMKNYLTRRLANVQPAPTQAIQRPSFLNTMKAKVSGLFKEKIPPSPPTPETGAAKERGFVTTVKQSPQATQSLKNLVSGTYNQKANTDLIASANARIAKDPIGATQFAMKDKTDEGVATAVQLVKKLSDEGNAQAAADIVNEKARQLTEAGRTIQAASLFDSLSPEGIGQLAAKTIQKYNTVARQKIPELTAEQYFSLVGKAKAIEKLPEGREKNIARHGLLEEINNLAPTPAWQKFVTVWKAGLLTSFRTTERNVLGNAIQLGTEVAKDVPAVLADKLMALRTGQRTLTRTTEGIREGGKKGLRAAKDIATTGIDPEQAVSKYTDSYNHITWGKNPVEQGLKKYTDAVFRTLGAEDKPFLAAAYMRSLYDQAGAAAINAGKSGDKAFIKNLVTNPTPAMDKIAQTDAAQAAFHDKTMLANMASKIKKVAGKNAITGTIAEVVAPFTGVPSSIASSMMKYSPIGLVKGIADTGTVLVKNVPNLQRQAAQEVGRGVIGTGLIGIGSFLASHGFITGQPKDTKEAQLWQAQGKTANSILLPDPDGTWKWRSIGSIGPENLIILAGAKFAQMQQEKQTPGQFAANLGKDFLAQTFLQGIQQPLAAITDPARYGQSYIGNQASSVIPNFLKDTARALDPLQRENNTTADYVTNAIPFLRNKNVVKRDVLGDPLPQEPGGIGNFIDLFNSKTFKTDSPLLQELSRLNDTGNGASPSKLAKSQTIHGTKSVLTPEQLDALESQVGPKVQTTLTALIKSEDYQRMTDEDKANAIGDAIAKVRSQVRAKAILPGEPIPFTAQKSKRASSTLPVFKSATKKKTTTLFGSQKAKKSVKSSKLFSSSSL